MSAAKAEKLSYSVKEFSELTGVSIDVLRRHIDSGSLVASYPSAKAMIAAAEGKRWLESLPNEKPGAAA